MTDLRSVGGALAAATLSLSAALPAVHAQSGLPRGVLWTPVQSPPASVVQWDAAERARGAAWTSSTFVAPAATTALTALPEAGGALLLGFELPGGRSVEARFERYERSLGHQVFRGHVVRGGGAESSVLVCVGPTGAVAGSFQIGDEDFSLHYTGVGNVHVVRTVDASRQPGCGNTPAQDVAAAGGAAAVPGAGPGAPAGGVGVAASNADTTIDVLAVYTPRARSTGGGTAAIEAELVLRVANATLGSELSGVPVRFRLVYQGETTYNEDGSTRDLSRFRSTSDGIMDEVHALRNQYGADLMHLITQPSSLQYCGVAYLMSRNTTGFASSAFGVTVRTCLSGETMTHELGHNISCHHDRANAGGSLYPYGYGYRTPDNRYRTVMAYRPGSRVNRWSSPNVQFNGYTLGVANREDNARAITNIRSTVERFRNKTVYEWHPIDGGVAGLFGEPELTGRGTSNTVAPVELVLERTPPMVAGVLVVGVNRIDQSLLGATLVPSPNLTIPVVGAGGQVVTDVSGIRTISPGLDLYVQAFFADQTGPAGLVASDAVQTTTL